MSEKTREELKEQIKIMNHNYQVIREMHEKGYQYSVGETKRLQDELERTRKALDVLLFTINRLENQNYKDCAWHLRLAIAKIKATGIANKALEQITTLEQKDAK